MNEVKFKKNLVDLLVEIDDRKLMNDVLKNLLTNDEYNEVATRLEVFKRLINGDTQREIAESLGVGIATVTRGSKELKFGPKGVLRVLCSWRKSV